MADSVISNFEFGSTAITLSSGLSIGYMVWLIRGGVILSSVLTSLPAWRTFDPLPVLDSINGNDNEADTESLEGMVDDANESEESSPNTDTVNDLDKKGYR